MSYDPSNIVTHRTEDGCPVVDPIAFSPEVAADPHPFYRALRTQCPVAAMPFTEMGNGYILSRFEDVKFALRNTEIFSSKDSVDIGQERPLIPLQIDPPEHVQWRRLMDPYLSPKQVALLEGDFRKLVNEIIDGFIDRPQINFHSQFAVPVPCTMFLRLIGLPTAEMERFVTWKDNIVRPQVAFGDVEAAQQIRRETGKEMYAYFREAIDARRSHPTDDLLSEFVHGQVDGRDLTDDEVLDIMYLFLLGGLDTVTATLDCSFSVLAGQPDRRRELMENPALIPGAVEEFLRFHTPVMGVVRTVTQPVEMHGVTMQPGDHVWVMLGAADTDESEFPDPHKLDFERADNKHYAFGGGPHRCLGSHLARLELRVAMEEFHKRVADYRLADGALLTFSPGIREIADLPMVIEPASV